MFKKILLTLFGIGIMVGISEVVNAQNNKQPDCEIGDVIFRNKEPEAWLGIGFHHAGIYFCSDSNPVKDVDFTVVNGLITAIHIKDSDFQHSVIESLGSGVVVNTFSPHYTIYPGGYKGPYNSGSLKAEDRRRILSHAYAQLGCKYPKYMRWPDIKKPASTPGARDGSFRCDGLVEYCYEVMV